MVWAVLKSAATFWSRKHAICGQFESTNSRPMELQHEFDTNFKKVKHTALSVVRLLRKDVQKASHSE